MTVNKTSGEYELAIPSVQEEDAGRYECIDGAGHGERQGAELVVLGTCFAFCIRLSLLPKTHTNLYDAMTCFEDYGSAQTRSLVSGSL